MVIAREPADIALMKVLPPSRGATTVTSSARIVRRIT
jgi:hypothetical protein